MKYELRRVEPLRAANIAALVYVICISVFSLIALPFFLLFALLSPTRETGIASAVFALMILLIYPIMGLVIGWLSGLIGSAVYNLVVRWTGGLAIELDLVPSPGTGAATPRTEST